MKAIRFISILLLSFFIAGNANAQLFKKLKKAVKKGVEDGVTRTVEGKVNKKSSEKTGQALDTIMGNGETKVTDTNDSTYQANPTESIEELEETSASSLEEEDADSDFKRGNIIIYEDNFSKDAVGDFPAKWNSEQGGEIRKLKGYEEKWLKIPSRSAISLDLSKPLPKNFTIEFDIIIPSSVPHRLAAFAFNEKPKYLTTHTDRKSYTYIIESQDKNNKYNKLHFGVQRKGNFFRYAKMYKPPLDSPIHVAIKVNNQQRIRMYLDGVKMVDAPRSFKPYMAKSFFFCAIENDLKESNSNKFYISNFILAESGIDKRSLVEKELLEKGTFTTNDILFSSGSDNIENSSANILNQIGKAMQTVPNTRFLIIGHTDSDGSDKTNQQLSQKRATAVKKYLIENFGINSNNLMCIGKGESNPIATNDTSEGKAQNRRVEFNKL